VERANSLQEVKDFKKLKGSARQYRLRIGDYRIGIVMEQDSVVFVRFLYRKEIYRYFP
jgi:mRNA interferase RelE/StbE